MDEEKKPFIDNTRKKQILAVIVFVVIFLVIRSFWLWYFKINALEIQLFEIQQQLTDIKNSIQ